MVVGNSVYLFFVLSLSRFWLRKWDFLKDVNMVHCWITVLYSVSCFVFCISLCFS